MAGMTVSIARMIHDGTITMAECAGRLGITRGQLDERLFLMERQGYLARLKEKPAAGSGCSCGHCCASCNGNPGVPVPAIVILTPKGERLIKGTEIR